MKRPRVHIHVGELVLHGFAAADRFAIAEALQARLVHALAPHISTLAGGSRDVVDAGTVRVADARPAHVGAAVAGEVARTIGGGRR